MTRDPNQSVSITEWLDQARDGDEIGRQQLWGRYYERLVRLAKSRLSAKDRRVSDEEDIAAVTEEVYNPGKRAAKSSSRSINS